MNQHPDKSYLNLIEQILHSPPEEEIGLLNAHRQLVTQRFIRCLMLTGENLNQSGKVEAAQRLIDLAQKLLAARQINLPVARRREYLQFLLTVLQQLNNKVNPQAIYNLLAQNKDKLDRNLAQILQYWTQETLSSVDLQQARAIASDLVNFSNLISEFPAGDRVSNLEIALIGYQAAIKVYQPTLFPQEWAVVQSNLANVWRDRLIGNRQENITKAIALYQLALEVLTEQNNPRLWGNIQRNLGIAYGYKLEGDYATAYPTDRSENIEKAIAAYHRALSVHNIDDFPQEWAASHNNLGDIYQQRLVGDKEENLEIAITHLEQALQIFNVNDFPHRWATLQNNLGNAFQSRLKGDKSNNLERAISCYQNALSIHTLEKYPYYWANLNNNLAGAYRHRLQGDKQENIRKAIAHLDKALLVYTQEKFPQQWADIQRNINNIKRENYLK